MPKKKSRKSMNKNAKEKMKYEIANEFGMNNGPEATSNKKSAKDKSCHKKNSK